MGAITYLQLKTNLPIIQEITNFRFEQKINEHAYCYLTGIIHEESKDNYAKEVNAENQIEVFTEGETRTTLFKGLIEQIQVEFIGGLYRVEIKGVSHSFQTDLKKKKRSFQDKNMTYERLVKAVMKEYSGGDIIDSASHGQTIDQLIVQYEETDWEFLKRLASHFNEGVLPTIEFDAPKLFFGCREGKKIGKLEQYEYKMHKDIGYYKHASENTNPDLGELDAVTFQINILENYEIEDQVNYQNINLYIKSKEMDLVKGILQFKYALCTKKGLTQNKIFNDVLVGHSIKGTVLEVIKDKIKVHLEIDKKQEVSTAWEFPYSTMYTAEGQSGWYCMPEVGDTVFIYFPAMEEHQAVGMSALRIGKKGTDKIDNPAIKYFRTINGKELKFSPEELVITCINGVDKETGENRVVYIKLNQNSGIEIISSEPITFKSDKGISLEAEETIKLIAAEQIILQCKQSQIRMDTMIDICSPDVKIN